MRGVDEVTILPGQAICIAGIVEREASTEPPTAQDELAYRETRKTRVWLRSDYEHPLLVGRPPD